MALIHEKLALINKEIGVIEKNQRNQSQGFNYRGVEDVNMGNDEVVPKEEKVEAQPDIGELTSAVRELVALLKGIKDEADVEDEPVEEEVDEKMASEGKITEGGNPEQGNPTNRNGGKPQEVAGNPMTGKDPKDAVPQDAPGLKKQAGVSAGMRFEAMKAVSTEAAVAEIFAFAASRGVTPI